MLSGSVVAVSVYPAAAAAAAAGAGLVPGEHLHQQP